MRHIHRKRLCQNIEGVPRRSQMLDQLNLIIPIIDEAFVEERSALIVPQHNVRFLEIDQHALQSSDSHIGVHRVPFGKHIQLEMKRRGNSDMRPNSRFSRVARARKQTGLQFRFVLRHEIETTRDDVHRPSTYIKTHCLNVRQLGRMRFLLKKNAGRITADSAPPTTFAAWRNSW